MAVYDPKYSLSAPRLAWQICVKKTEVKLELLADVDKQKASEVECVMPYISRQKPRISIRRIMAQPKNLHNSLIFNSFFFFYMYMRYNIIKTYEYSYMFIFNKNVYLIYTYANTDEIYILYIRYSRKKPKSSLLKIFRLLPLSIHYYQQVIFLLCYTLKRIYKS